MTAASVHNFGSFASNFSLQSVNTSIWNTIEKIIEWGKPFFQKAMFYGTIFMQVVWAAIKNGISKLQPIGENLLTQLQNIYHVVAPIIASASLVAWDFIQTNPLPASMIIGGTVITVYLLSKLCGHRS